MATCQFAMSEGQALSGHVALSQRQGMQHTQGPRGFVDCQTSPRIMAGKPDERSVSRVHLRQSRPSLAITPRHGLARMATDVNGRNGNTEVFRAEKPTQVGPAEGNKGSQAPVPPMAGIPRRRMQHGTSSSIAPSSGVAYSSLPVILILSSRICPR